MDLAHLQKRARETFERRFGVKPGFLAAAPGRVNLIGEHTDYNDGYVLPMAIDRYTVVAGARVDVARSPGADVYSATLDQRQHIPFDSAADVLPTWSRYVKGVIDQFANSVAQPLSFAAVIDSTVPLGGGLSSSAALEVATVTFLQQVTGAVIEPMEMALLCQRAEHQGVGMPCGIMDQFTSVLARRGYAMLLDCRDHRVEHVPLDDPSIVVLVIDSNVKHELATGEYAQRRRQCLSATKILGIESLRELSPAELPAALAELDTTVGRRVRHVVTENSRTTAAADALRSADWPRLGELMFESHDSLRDDYEVSCRELDALVEAARTIGSTGGVIGSRMTGGGFGGCTVSLVERTQASDVLNSIVAQCRRTGLCEPRGFVTTPADGAQALLGPT